MTRQRPDKSTQQFDPAGYLEHLMGLSVMMAWRARWLLVKAPCELRGPLLTLGALPSQRFALGFPRRPRYGRHPFLAVQPDEGMFFDRVSWGSAWLDLPAARLVLVTRKVLGDSDSLEDIPAMALSIWFDHASKLAALVRSDRLAFRSLWFDEDGAHVATGKPMGLVRLRVLEEGQSPFPPGACAQDRSMADLVTERLSRTPGGYLPYEGARPMVSGQFQDLVSPFQPEQVPQVKAK